MNELIIKHLKQCRMNFNMLEDEISGPETHVAIERVTKLVESLAALRYALFQQKPSGTP